MKNPMIVSDLNFTELTAEELYDQWWSSILYA